MDRNLREKVLLKILPEGEFHQNGDEFVFRCPFCGDSKRDNKKRRFGYNIVKDSAHCFNCGIGFPNAFRNVVEKLTGKEMLDLVVSVMDGTEIIKTIEKVPVLKHHEETVVPETFDDFLQDECYIVSEHMSMGKAAHDYLVSRKLDKVDRDFYYCHDNSSRYFGRLIIPFFNEEGECVYFQARYLGHEKMKIKYLNPHGSKDVVFGMDRVDKSKIVPVLEGPFDAMFVENAVAICSSSPSKIQMDILEGMDIVFMFDNDAAGLRSMRKLAKKGYKVIKWSDNFEWEQDVNDYIMGLSFPKPKLYLETFVKPAILHPFQAEVILTMELKKRGLN